jgi:hypothetical protein
MRTFIETLFLRNEVLTYFGLLNLLFALIMIIVSRFDNTLILGANAWFKPIKFALSIGIYSLTMAWFNYYLGPGFPNKLFNWGIVLILGFEIIYIIIQASRGQQSHFNNSTSFYSIMYALMGIGATLVSLMTLAVGIVFFVKELPELPDHYLWSIRIGIIIFVIFSLEGFVMGSRSSHTIGASDGGKGIPFLNWSLTHGDARIPHFIGMHALQVLPLLSYYLLKNVKLTFASGILYLLLAVYTLILALNGKPLIK